MDNNELKHFGVLGMRWGTRRGQLYRKQTMLTPSRQAKLDKHELSKLQRNRKIDLRSAHQKKIDSKKIAILKKRVNATKEEKMAAFSKPDAARAKKIKDTAKSIAAVAVSLGTLVVLDQTVGKAMRMNIF